MKKLITLLSIIIVPLFVISQPCLPDGITFVIQAEIDSFQINHPHCTEIEGDVLIIGDYITNLNGLSVLTSFGGSLEIRFNPILTSLTGLEGLTSIGGDLAIIDNDTLSSLIGLDNVTSIGGDLGIHGNDSLTSLTGLENIISIGGNIGISYNDSLTSLTGLEGVTSIGGYLSIAGNDALTSLKGLEGLTSIGGYLSIYDNDAFTSLTGLEGVTSIGGYLKIENNNALTSLTGLDNVTSIGGHLWIYDNPYLSTCEVESVCAYLASPNGIIDIFNNATGCNSPEEVQDSCEAHAIIIDKYLTIEGFSVSPNPFTASTTLSYTLSKTENVQFTIYNVQSQIVFMKQERQNSGEQKMKWNAEGLHAGMYYFRIKAGDKVGSGKMVKME